MLFISRSPDPARAAYAGFAAFGAFWGTWGACLPAIRDHAGLSDGQLGTALVFVGAGALPAMPLTGRAVDRWGHRVTVALLPCLGLVGIVVAVTGGGLAGLCLAFAAAGAVSGGVDVAINTSAGSAERTTRRPVVTRAHGGFSVAVVVAGLGTGLLRDNGFTPIVPFLLVAAGTAAATAAAWAGQRSPVTEHPARTPSRPNGGQVDRRPLIAIGILGALAFAVENAHQSWSAVYLDDVHAAGPAVAAAGPATFAAAVALGRFSLGAVRHPHPTVVLMLGSGLAAGGTTIVAASPSVTVALTGLAVAAAGTGVLYPTLISLVTARVDDATRGGATALVATVAYLGFLAGPAFVGGWAELVGLPGAMVAVAAVAVLLGLLVTVATRVLRRSSGRAPGRRSGAARRDRTPATPRDPG